jgi:hypothetical protein
MHEVSSGVYQKPKWVLLEDIKTVLAQAGFASIEVAEHRDERNGPRVLFFARRAS